MNSRTAAVICAAIAPFTYAGIASASHESPQMTQESALLAGDRMWPGHACEGRVHVIVGPTTSGADGEATGIEFWWNGTEWQWVRANCSITILPNLQPQRRCRVIVHEIGHLASNAGHTNDGGIMDGVGSYAAVPGCQEIIVGHKPEPTLTKRQQAYREAKHDAYHEPSNPHPDRKTLAQKWHKLGNER